MKKLGVVAVSLVGAMGLAACQTTTVGEGRLGGSSKNTVAFEVTENFFGDSGAQAVATMPDGEVFRGKLVTAKRQTENFGDEFYGGWDDFDDFDDFDDGFGGFAGGFGGFYDEPFFTSYTTTTYSPFAQGVLFGAKRSMQCRITLANPRAGFSDGGTGRCKLSNGSSFPVQF